MYINIFPPVLNHYLHYLTITWSPLKYTIQKYHYEVCDTKASLYMYIYMYSSCTLVINMYMYYAQQLSQADNDGEVCFVVALLPPAAR